MSNLEAELARFEAEISSLPSPSLPAPNSNQGARVQPSHPPSSGHHGMNHSIPRHPPHGSMMRPPPMMPHTGVSGFPSHMNNSPAMVPGSAGMSMHAQGSMMGMGMGASVSMPAVPNQHAYMAEPEDSQGAYHAGNIMYGGNGLSAAQVNALDSKKAGNKASADNTKGKVMQAAGKRWRDPTLDEWPENDHRIFVGDLGNEVNDESLANAFRKYSSFAKAKIVRDNRTHKSKGFGFVSFLDSADFAKALKEMQGKYIGNRPCKLSKSTWDERLAPKNKQGKKQKS
ncbi:hypothetical protein CEUSTIGMA_g4803.t1 [Chlamydomonas eustigma]|uniref:RRM domain-containing protein n=1 Tax=Chlamydomonas eustigma TaxID=1157962 RepID=A0A250X2Q9_9CHLO|nr:hypothetical protein CEUSTIGMA_g4803.t1 [Chlamydomonas eustigma]|eukprot:GAX77357.1 hypothetical protein CEUSTIGMA_g4803.t1 [Chlamydomonas eustigma]